jgi:uncharacterized protein (TIGR04255 family)
MRVPGGTDPARVLEAAPFVPAPIPQVIRDFLTRIYIEDALRNLSAVIIQALEQRVDTPGAISFLLDIDAFREVTTAPDDPQLQVTFEQLRKLKNEIFFGSITEHMAEIYE